MLDDPDRPSAEMRIGTILCGKYRLDALLGVGGMASVYAATHRNRAPLAIKVLHPDLASIPGARERFLREAYAANSVGHRNAVRIVDDDVTEDGALFLVMERLSGASVEELREQCGGAMNVPAAVAIVEQLLDVLAAAHAKGIVHRDIKPANLFVTMEGDLKVLDFGVARTRETLPADLSLTGSATILGTPAFMAPEQSLAGMTAIDARTDLWAAGATLFTLLSGRTVHEADSVVDLLARAALDRAPSIVEVAPRVPRAIAEVIDCALAFDKAARWANADEMRAALLAAYRFHFRSAPSRARLVALVGAPASGVTTTRPPSGKPRSHLTPYGEDLSPSGAHVEGRALPSRTSVPLAAEVSPAQVSNPSWRPIGLLTGALLALAPFAWLGERAQFVAPMPQSDAGADGAAALPAPPLSLLSIRGDAATCAPLPPSTGTAVLRDEPVSGAVTRARRARESSQEM